MPIHDVERGILNSQEALQNVSPHLGASLGGVNEARQAMEGAGVNPQIVASLSEAHTSLSGVTLALAQYKEVTTSFLRGLSETSGAIGQTMIAASVATESKRPEITLNVNADNREAVAEGITQETLRSFMAAKSEVSSFLREHGLRARPRGVSLDEIAVLHGVAKTLKNEDDCYGAQLSKVTGLGDAAISVMLERLEKDGVLISEKQPALSQRSGPPRRIYTATPLGVRTLELLPGQSPSMLLGAKARIATVLREEGAQPRPKGLRLDEVVILHGIAPLAQSELGFTGVRIAEHLGSDQVSTTATLLNFEKDDILSSEMEKFGPENPKGSRGARRIFQFTGFGRQVLDLL